MKAQVLIVEDEPEILHANKQMLKRRGYDVLTAETEKEAIEALEKYRPDLLVLDIMLPDGNGFEICKKFRLKSSNPILFLSAKSDITSRIDGLKIGGDYYLTKPFHFDELLAIIERLLIKQKELAQKTSVTIGDLYFDYSTFTAKLVEKDINLTKIEATILSVFIQNINKEISSDFLYEQVWKTSDYGNSRVLKTHISRLKQKIDCENTDNYDILAIYGKGYIFTMG